LSQSDKILLYVILQKLYSWDSNWSTQSAGGCMHEWMVDIERYASHREIYTKV